MTRRARLLVLAAAIWACEENKVPPPAPSAAPASPASVAATLGIDADLVEGADPPAPAGDLRADLERFVNVDACVAERAAKLEPLVGDALRAIGYDTFVRDACRLLDSARDKKRESCDKIDASALRARCQTWVAILAQSPDACPMVIDGAPGRGRVASCVAVAARDLRLCAAETRLAARDGCEAMITREEARCDPLLPGDRAACKRELARWRSLLPPPLEGLPTLPAARGKLVIRGEGGAPDAAAPETDLGPELARGIVVVTARPERARAELGGLDAAPGRIAGSPNRRVRVGVALVVDPDPLRPNKEPKPALERLELELPGEPPLACTPPRCTLALAAARLDRQRGGEVSVKLSGKIDGGGRSYEIELDAATFVRDVVSDVAGPGRLIPPSHPPLLGLPRDGGS